MSQNISNLPLYNKPQTGQIPPNTNFSAGMPVSNGANIQNNPIVQQAEKLKENNGGGFAANAVIAGVGLLGINEFLNRGLQGDYDKSFLKKFETSVDKLGSKPKFVKFSNYISGKLAALKTKLNKSEIYKTMTTKQSLGGPQVQSQAVGARGHLANRAVEVMKKYKEANPSFTNFDTILGKAGKDAYKHMDEIIETIQKSGADKTLILKKRPWWGLGIIKNKSNLNEILNKDMLVRSYKNIAKSGETISLGKKAAGYLMRGTECLTNGMFGGKGQVLIQALMVAQSLQEARKAEKGEKVATFSASLLELMAFMATMGVQMRIMNGLAGLKFTGWTKAQHGEYQEAMKALNNAAKAGDAATVNAQKNIIKGIKDAVKAGSKPTFIQKIAKGFGNIFSFGRINETMKPLKGSFFKKIPYGLKVGVGYAGRVALIMGVIIPIFSGIAKKISYGIFGKPVKTLEREKLKEKEAETQQSPGAVQQPVQPQQPQQVAPAVSTQSAQPGDLMNTMNQTNQQAPMAAQSMAPDSTPLAANSLQEAQKKIKRSYVPNPVLGVENTVKKSEARTPQIDSIMRKADLAEAEAQKYI